MIAVLLANGFEEIEALTPVDILRRAGLEVLTVGVQGKVAVGSHGIPVTCDTAIADIDSHEVTAVVLPGGMPGSVNLADSTAVRSLILSVNERGGRIAAICAAPLVLGRLGLLNGKRATCYPGFEGELVGATVIGESVVTDGSITTAKGAGVALAFAKELVSLLVSSEKAEEISAAIMEHSDATVRKTVSKEEEKEASPSVSVSYTLPTGLLAEEKSDDGREAEIQNIRERLATALEMLSIKVDIAEITCGPRLIRCILSSDKISRLRAVAKNADTLTLILGVSSVRAELCLRNSTVMLDIPREKPCLVRLRSLIESAEFGSLDSKTAICIGIDTLGAPVVADLAKMPHLIVAGATGMGKSVCMNSLILSILYKAKPDEVKFILIDPKKVEFTQFRSLPHLLIPVVTDPRQAAGALMWAVEQMEKRYEIIEKARVRNIDAYNAKVIDNPGMGEPMPKIVIVIDELADLMLQAKNPVESLIMSISAKARAAGIHLIIGTQRPSVDVITGVIKANIPSRICFKVASASDSKTVLDEAGAEMLLDRGDMFFLPVGTPVKKRVQGAFVSDSEVEKVVDYLAAESTEYDRSVSEEIDKITKSISTKRNTQSDDYEAGLESPHEYEPLLQAAKIAIETGKISTSLLQRKMSIGYGKACRLIDMLEDIGVVGESNGQKPRDVLITWEEWLEKLKNAEK